MQPIFSRKLLGMGSFPIFLSSILCCIMLPEMTGVELLRRVKSFPRLRSIPVVLLTAMEDLESKNAGFAAGADDYVTKPFQPVELCLRLRGLLRLNEYHDRLEEVDNILKSMVAIVEAKDVYTKGHSLRVAQLVAAMGREVNLEEEKMETLYRAGLLHDIGKIVVDSGCLNKPGPLEPKEMAVIRRHPETGAVILGQMQRTAPIVPLVRDHHEHLDGSGYPAGKRGQEISFLTRLLSCADVYDALTSDRPYRKAMPRESALGIIEAEVAKGWWDLEAFRLLERVVEMEEGYGHAGVNY
ncbi:HD domain-containing phosphohydrolase [Neomoorella glycerini]